MDAEDLRLILESLDAFRSDYEGTSYLPEAKMARMERLKGRLESQLEGR